MFGQELNGVIEVAGFEKEYPPKVFLGLGIGAIGDSHFAATMSQGGGPARRVERLATDKVSATAQFVVVGYALGHERLLLRRGHSLPVVLIHISQANESHDGSPHGEPVDEFDFMG
jgi:hypothetical protein